MAIAIELLQCCDVLHYVAACCSTLQDVVVFTPQALHRTIAKTTKHNAGVCRSWAARATSSHEGTETNLKLF